MAEQGLESKDSKFTYKVNGTQFDSESEFLTARQILEMAAKAGVIPGKPDEYYLEGDKGRYKDDDKIDLQEDSIFITIPHTPTPVASRNRV
ncbi:MAG: hypothetical protein F4Z00_03135 [Acidimicrobiaceae bacterium]|nr:hypothetical protein [Acidimicrobiaceae bacterium]MYF33792.1 hypothetical protein [Acidimicrobiaceae bacterium]MYG78463.1 hypothetical protein [Acidimicrobiaceae bacterium]MYJ85220.1 hypothetical protein [Acidimicrobiaceae bacterium]